MRRNLILQSNIAYVWLNTRSGLVILIGAVCAGLLALYSNPIISLQHFQTLKRELLIHEDLHNLYYASARATWQDSLSWWTGPWNYPGVGYYRPLTSVLFLGEYQLFGDDFFKYSRVTLGLHSLNTVLLFLLIVSLIRRPAVISFLVGMTGAYFFATPASSMHFANSASILWWPAQNDPLSLTFGLISLLLLNLYLSGKKRVLLAGSLVSFYLSVASKEMGLIIAPMAIALAFQRNRKLCPVSFYFAVFACGLYLFRLAVVPHSWMPNFLSWRVLDKALIHWSGDHLRIIHANVFWLPITALALTVTLFTGVRKNWSIYTILAAIVVVACLGAQFLSDGGNFALLLEPSEVTRLIRLITFELAIVLFWKYRRDEPGLFAAAAFILSFVPILGFAGYHYFYWPGAFLALADAVFLACLIRWVVELSKSITYRPPPFLAKVMEPKIAHGSMKKGASRTLSPKCASVSIAKHRPASSTSPKQLVP